MGRSRRENKNQPKALSSTNHTVSNTLKSDADVNVDTSDKTVGPSIAPSKPKKVTIKLEDVVKDALVSVYNSQRVSVSDSEVYASGQMIGRIPSSSDVTQGTGKIYKVDKVTVEVWIRI
jgi:hypothetical protein